MRSYTVQYSPCTAATANAFCRFSSVCAREVSFHFQQFPVTNSIMKIGQVGYLCIQIWHDTGNLYLGGLTHSWRREVLVGQLVNNYINIYLFIYLLDYYLFNYLIINILLGFCFVTAFAPFGLPAPREAGLLSSAGSCMWLYMASSSR